MEKKKKIIVAIFLLILLAILLFAIVQNSKSNEIEVTFDCHGGSAVENLKIQKGETIKEPEKPTKDGYQFIGWYYEGKKFNFNEEIEHNIKLEAKWLKVGTIKHTVTFDSSGGTEISLQKIENGKTAKKPENPTKDGYTFIGWLLDGKTYDFKSKVEKSITLTALWKENYVNNKTTNVSVKEEVKKETIIEKVPIIEKPEEKEYIVKFYDEGMIVDTKTVKEGELLSSPVLNPRKDYIFLNWVTDEGIYDFSEPVTKDLNIYAVWSRILNLHTASTIDFSTLPESDMTNNQKAIKITQNDNDIMVIKNDVLTQYENDDSKLGYWYGIQLDFGVEPSSLEIISQNHDDITLESAAGKYGNSSTSTAFIIWLDIEDPETKDVKELTFNWKDKDLVRTISIKVREALKFKDVSKLTLDPNKQYPADMKYNHESIDIAKVQNIITITENRAMVDYEYNGVTAQWYGLIFDFGIDPNKITVNGNKMNQNDIDDAKEFGSISDTAFVLWLKGDDHDFETQLVFGNTEILEDQLTITIQFDAKVGVLYENVEDTNTVVINAPNTYDSIKQIFSIDPNIEEFTFFDNGTEKKAYQNEDHTWLIEDVSPITFNIKNIEKNQEI